MTPRPAPVSLFGNSSESPGNPQFSRTPILLWMSIVGAVSGVRRKLGRGKIYFECSRLLGSITRSGCACLSGVWQIKFTMKRILKSHLVAGKTSEGGLALGQSSGLPAGAGRVVVKGGRSLAWADVPGLQQAAASCLGVMVLGVYCLYIHVCVWGGTWGKNQIVSTPQGHTHLACLMAPSRVLKSAPHSSTTQWKWVLCKKSHWASQKSLVPNLGLREGGLERPALADGARGTPRAPHLRRYTFHGSASFSCTSAFTALPKKGEDSAAGAPSASAVAMFNRLPRLGLP